MSFKTLIQEDGEFAGWRYYPDEPFEARAAGPFFARADDKGPVTAFRVQEKHLNGHGVAHGGLLMTLADTALFEIASSALDQSASGVTVAFSAEFLGSAALGDYVEARGELLRSGGSLLFARGLATAEGRPCLSFSGTIKRIRPPR